MLLKMCHSLNLVFYYIPTNFLVIILNVTLKCKYILHCGLEVISVDDNLINVFHSPHKICITKGIRVLFSSFVEIKEITIQL